MVALRSYISLERHIPETDNVQSSQLNNLSSKILTAKLVSPFRVFESNTRLSKVSHSFSLESAPLLPLRVDSHNKSSIEKPKEPQSVRATRADYRKG
jgi:hypothetical protein